MQLHTFVSVFLNNPQDIANKTGLRIFMSSTSTYGIHETPVITIDKDFSNSLDNYKILINEIDGFVSIVKQ